MSGRRGRGSGLPRRVRDPAGAGRQRATGGAPAQPALDVVQRWFQAVVTHPGGVAAGVESPAAQGCVRLERAALESLVRRSTRLTAEQRLSIYANAYYARLLECLGDCFPVLKQVLGGEVFDGFAFDYLQRYPSRSYTLDRLAESFPRFLEETRPDRAPAAGGPGAEPAAAGAGTGASAGAGAGAGAAAPPPGFPDFLIDLASLELAIARVFDGPGAEGVALLAAADLPPAGRFAAARLVPVPCLCLLRFRYPVNAFYTAARALLASIEDAAAARPAPGDEAAVAELPFPEPRQEHVALSRTDFVVRRYTLTALEHQILAALQAGAPVGEAIAAGAAASELDDDQLAARLDAAFRRWTAAGFFLRAAAGGGQESAIS